MVELCDDHHATGAAGGPIIQKWRLSFRVLQHKITLKSLKNTQTFVRNAIAKLSLQIATLALYHSCGKNYSFVCVCVCVCVCSRLSWKKGVLKSLEKRIINSKFCVTLGMKTSEIWAFISEE